MTAWASYDGSTIVSGRVTIPFWGTWCADVTLSSSAAVASQAPLVIGDLTLLGAVTRSVPYAGSRTVRLVGGAGGWRQMVPARAYASPAGVRLSMVLKDVATEVGETVAFFGPADSIGLAYVREAGPAQRVLRQLAGELWWITPAGVTAIQGTRDVSLIKSAFDVLDYRGASGRVHVATEVLADWMPGRTFTAPTLEGATLGIGAVSLDFTTDGKARLEVLSS